MVALDLIYMASYENSIRSYVSSFPPPPPPPVLVARQKTSYEFEFPTLRALFFGKMTSITIAPLKWWKLDMISKVHSRISQIEKSDLVVIYNNNNNSNNKNI